MLTVVPDRAARLGTDESGMALVEFALSLPVVLMLVLGGLEASNLALTHLRVSQVAVTTADNAARVKVQMDESDVEEIFAGAEVVGKSIDLAAHGRVVLSSIEDNGRPGNGRGQMIRWQRCHGSKNEPPAYGREGKGKADADLKNGLGPPGRRIAAQPGTAVMFVEVTYDYQALAFSELIGDLEIRYEAAYNVRERTELGITNTRGKPPKGC